MFTCTKCQKREFQMTQLSEMRLLAECAGCGSSFVVDSISDKKSRIEAADPNQHLTWNWKSEQWVPARREYEHPQTSVESAHVPALRYVEAPGGVASRVSPSGPTYSASGRNSRLSCSCSDMWAVQPTVLAHAKVQVKSSGGITTACKTTEG